ncbi:zonular occludens toxin domain-containing protein [Rodentibacter pneumotropicus]|uniref:zonular occludens toxin domain-containing protein n=1 Tax=Rodentibacter pneumotropicus TaxID=758 RepID=UPI0005EE463C|nr:zonular occludens toxin domain-containing protein [Rodentibacter pneumotropicus]TGZ99347.1 hypothetical protein D3M72_09640 [Rodentibacter pneumotropicus]THA16688.1 hypothetical protein D3M82_02515 [Rodentibacter pneumotropicus]
MAINAYVGIPGSGKTYEVVHSVILPAFLAGRRIVTNIEGIDESKFIDYVEKQNETRKEHNQIDTSRLGKIIQVEDDDVLKSEFFPYKGSNDEETIAKNGDLICIDEIWRIFDDSKKIKDEHRSFIAEHRHFVNAEGNTSDLVVINQSVSNIPRFIKDRIETTYKMTKLKSLGLDNRYRIDVYSGSKTFKTNLIHSIQAKYDPLIFPLYKSYDGDNAREQAIDDRSNLLKNKFFIAKMVLSVLFMIISGIYFYNYFNPDLKPKDDKVETIKSEKNNKAKKMNDALEPKTKREQYKENKAETENAPLSLKWRIVGNLERKGKKLIILSDGNYLRYEQPSNFIHSGNRLIVLICLIQMYLS